jgi:hypothetical protein
MLIECGAMRVELINEPEYKFGSSDNVRRYPYIWNVSEEAAPNSIHGLLVNDRPMAVLGNAGGLTGIHDHSAVSIGDMLYVAIGSHVVCLRLRPFQFVWALQTDPFTCFGVYFDEEHNALVSHGELEISRFTDHGTLLWNSSGSDIFSQGFTLLPEFIEAMDFHGKIYRFDYFTGNQT